MPHRRRRPVAAYDAGKPGSAERDLLDAPGLEPRGDPGAVIAPGYPNAMPADYGTKISPQQLNQLIDFLVKSAAADAQG